MIRLEFGDMDLSDYFAAGGSETVIFHLAAWVLSFPNNEEFFALDAAAILFSGSEDGRLPDKSPLEPVGHPARRPRRRIRARADPRRCAGSRQRSQRRLGSGGARVWRCGDLPC